MDRLIASNSVPLAQADTAPTTGTPQYATDGNPATNVPATLWPAYAFNALQDEIYNVIVGAGLTPDRNAWNQLIAAIRRIGQNTLVLADTGAVNAYTAVNAVPLVSGASPTWVDGVVQAVKIAHTNTGPSTYAPDGLAAIPIYGLGLQPLQGGELLLNGTAILMHATIAGVNSGNPICVLMECPGGAQQIPAATQPLHAVQKQQLGNMQGVVTVSANTALTAIQAGSYVQISSGSGLTVTLPPAVAGAAFPIYNNTNATHTLKGSGSQVINNGSGNSNTYTILPWAAIWVTSDGASFSIISGAGDVLLTTNGWERKPSGLIECWAQGTTNSSGTVTITLPITFPNSQLIGMVCGQNGTAVAACVTLQSLSTSQIIVNAVNGSASPINGLQVNIRALGK